MNSVLLGGQLQRCEYFLFENLGRESCIKSVFKILNNWSILLHFKKLFKIFSRSSNCIIFLVVDKPPFDMCDDHMQFIFKLPYG